VDYADLARKVRSRKKRGEQTFMKLAPSDNAPTQSVVQAMDLGRKYDVELILTIGK
jgi:hypothetical protein